MIKVAFLGTPSIGANALRSLIDHNDIEVTVVVTVPDKAMGRSHSELQPSAVAKLAQEHNLNIIKTTSINKDIDQLKAFEFEYILTCAFGQFLSDDVLALPTKKALNIHGSLLPEGRGGAPIHWSIIKGKEKTGISIMEMVSAMDAGDFYSQYEINITPEDNTDTLFDKMSALILEKSAIGLIDVDNGKESTVQDEEKVTFWMNIKKEDSKVDFSKTNVEVHNQIRGLTSKPGAWSTIDGKIVKIHSSSLTAVPSNDHKPGEIVDINDFGIFVATKDGLIIINELTLEGSKRTLTNNITNNNVFKKENIFE